VTKRLTRTLPASRRRRSGSSAAVAPPRDDHRGGRDPLVATYERGPFVAAPVPDWPQGLAELVERLTGKPFDPILWAHYERARAFTGYQGVEVTPQLAREQWDLALNDDPHPDRAGKVVQTPSAARAPTAAPATAARPSLPVTAGGIDPHDLGD